jgi:site-specific recombinase XerD
MNSTALQTQHTGTELERSHSEQAQLGAWLLELDSPNTRAAYRRDLAGFLDFLQALATEEGAEAPALLSVSRQLVALYAENLRGEGRAASTIARKLSALSSFYSYAVAEGWLESSPVANLKRPKVSEESPTLGPDRVELSQLLEAAQELGAKEYALMSLLGLVGLRVSEVTGATVSDLGRETGRAGKEHRTLKVRRKGGKAQTVALPALAVQALEPLVEGREEGALLVRASGLPLDRYDCGRIVARIAKRAGVEKHLSPHSLRHGFVTLSLEAGEPLHAVQEAAGHADPRTTLRYDRARQNLDRSPTYALERFVLAE